MNRTQASQAMSALTGGVRSVSFFEAWQGEENGWGEVVPNNNPANISGPINHELAWFNGAVNLLENNVVVFDTMEHGVQNTISLMKHYYPHVFTCATDEEAIAALGQPDIYGEFWATNPQYAQQILTVYHELTHNTHSSQLAQPVSSGGHVWHRVVGGDTLWELAVKNGITLAQIEHLNPQICNPNIIRVGEEVRVK